MKTTCSSFSNMHLFISFWHLKKVATPWPCSGTSGTNCHVGLGTKVLGVGGRFNRSSCARMWQTQSPTMTRDDHQHPSIVIFSGIFKIIRFITLKQIFQTGIASIAMFAALVLIYYQTYGGICLINDSWFPWTSIVFPGVPKVLSDALYWDWLDTISARHWDSLTKREWRYSEETNIGCLLEGYSGRRFSSRGAEHSLTVVRDCNGWKMVTLIQNAKLVSL